MTKTLNIHMYFAEPASRRFAMLYQDDMIEAIFNFLVEENQVNKMLEYTRCKRPAMEGIIEELESKFFSFDLEYNMKYRQILGSMIRFIMGHYGYRPMPARAMKKGRYVKTAIVYSLN